MCCLSKPDDRPELDGIRNKWVTPKELIKVWTGVNEIPFLHLLNIVIFFRDFFAYFEYFELL